MSTTPLSATGRRALLNGLLGSRRLSEYATLTIGLSSTPVDPADPDGSFTPLGASLPPVPVVQTDAVWPDADVDGSKNNAADLALGTPPNGSTTPQAVAWGIRFAGGSLVAWGMLDAPYTPQPNTPVVIPAGTLVIRNVSPGAPAAGVPTAPYGVAAVAGTHEAIVSWHAPVDDGGSPVAGYQVTASSGQDMYIGDESTTLVFEPLDADVPVTFTVHAQNVVGNSPESAPSAPVTPTGPVVIVDEHGPYGPVTGFTAHADPEGRIAGTFDVNDPTGNYAAGEFAHYLVAFPQAPLDPAALVLPVTSPFTTDVLPAGDYLVHVESQAGGGDSQSSIEIPVTVAEPTTSGLEWSTDAAGWTTNDDDVAYAGGPDSDAWIDSGLADNYAVSFTVAALTGQYPLAALVRFTSASNRLYIFRDNSAARWAISDGGVASIGNVGTAAPAVGDRFRVEARGTTYKLFVNDALVDTFTHAGLAGNTKQGLLAGNPLHVTGFAVTALPAAASYVFNAAAEPAGALPGDFTYTTGGFVVDGGVIRKNDAAAATYDSAFATVAGPRAGRVETRFNLAEATRNANGGNGSGAGAVIWKDATNWIGVSASIGGGQYYVERMVGGVFNYTNTGVGFTGGAAEEKLALVLHDDGTLTVEINGTAVVTDPLGGVPADWATVRKGFSLYQGAGAGVRGVTVTPSTVQHPAGS